MRGGGGGGGDLELDPIDFDFLEFERREIDQVVDDRHIEF